MPRRTPSAGTLTRAAACALAAVLACGEPNRDRDGGAPTACSAASATATRDVLVTAGQFLPYCTKVPAGVTVTFTNADRAAHTVTADAGQPEQFDSGLLQPGQRFEHAFAAPAIVRVHCGLSPEVSGRVVVE